MSEMTYERLAEAFGHPHPMEWPDPPRLNQRKIGKELARFNRDLEKHSLPRFTEQMLRLFWSERADGQSYTEDCGGFLLRPWLAAYGAPQRQAIVTHEARANQLIANKVGATDPLTIPSEPGGFAGDIFFGDPNNSTRGTHRWDGSQWVELPDERVTLAELLAKAREQRDYLRKALISQLQWVAHWRVDAECKCVPTDISLNAAEAEIKAALATSPTPEREP